MEGRDQVSNHPALPPVLTGLLWDRNVVILIIMQIPNDNPNLYHVMVIEHTEMRPQKQDPRTLPKTL